MDRYKRYTPYGCSCGARAPMAAKVQSSEYCVCDKQPISLAMAYVKSQELKELYNAREALSKGTLFNELYKPYCQGGFRR